MNLWPCGKHALSIPFNRIVNEKLHNLILFLLNLIRNLKRSSLFITNVDLAWKLHDFTCQEKILSLIENWMISLSKTKSHYDWKWNNFFFQEKLNLIENNKISLYNEHWLQWKIPLFQSPRETIDFDSKLNNFFF